MRASAVVALVPLAACSSVVFADPQIQASPYYAIYQLRGDMTIQTNPGAGLPPQDNPEQPLRTFGQDHHGDDVGFRADIGDGFSGFRIDYYRFDENTTRHGVLDADWGNLLAGDVVRMDATMDEVRVGYVLPIGRIETTWRERPLTFQFAGGAVLAHRMIDLHARTEDGARRQNVKIEDAGVVYPAARARAAWREFALDAEYAISPELNFGGDFDHVLQDLEIRASYTLPMRELTVFAGYRYSELPASGIESGLEFDADLRLDGFEFGVTLIL
jgi:hypothetical protein